MKLQLLSEQEKKMNRQYILLLYILLSFSLVNCDDDMTPEESKAIMCTKKIKSIMALTYGPFACMAEVLGANFSAPNSSLPERFVKNYHPEIAKWSVLHTMEAFTNWYCNNFDLAFKIVISTNYSVNLTKEETEMLTRCYIDEISVAIEEEVCINSTSIGKSLEVERFKCMKEVDPKSNCVKEMMGEEVPDDKFNEWLCQEEPNVERYVTTKFVCLPIKETRKYSKCVHSALSKLIKSK